MSELRWYQIIAPREMDLAAATAVVRTLASRPRYGLAARPALVVFELWGENREGRTEIRWQLGIDSRAAKSVVQAMRSQLPSLGIVAAGNAERPKLLLGAEIRLRGQIHPLRTDTAEAVANELQATLRWLGKGQVAVVQWLVGPGKDRSRQPEPFRLGEALGLQPKNKPDAGTRRSFRQKAAEPLLGCRGRIAAGGATTDAAWSVIGRLYGGLQLANGSHARLRLSTVGKHVARTVMTPTLPLTWSCVLSASELATVLGWPVQAELQDDLPLVGGHISLAPEALLRSPREVGKQAKERVIGESLHPAQRGRLVGMPDSASLHHLHLIGPTGSGKSTLLTHLILADITAGRGVLVLEPRGDLVEDVLARIPASRRDDVVVIDPADAAKGLPVVGLNVLAGPLETAERRADEIVGLLAAMHGPNFGPRTADVALHAILTASRLPEGTLPDVVALLTNPAFRREVVAKVADPLVLSPWWAGFEALSDGERRQHVSPLLNKLRAFLSRDSLRRMVGQARPPLGMEDVFTEQRIVLVNLNRGMLGGPTANLLGALVLSQAWSALQRRASLHREKRTITGLFVDEFQDYVGVDGGLDFGDALAQSRGLGGAWTLAHQNLGQLPSKLEEALTANARSRISFRPSPGDARALAGVFGSKLNAEDLLRLNAYEAVAQIHLDGQPTQPFGVQTRALGPWTGQADALRTASAKRYGVDGQEVDTTLTAKWQGGDKKPGRVGVRKREARS